MSDKHESQIEATHTEKRGGFKKHMKRFWWMYLIALVLIIVLVVLLIIFVAVPKIAQQKLNDAELEIQGVNILQTTPDEYHMEINSTIKSDGKIKAKIYPFTGSMKLEDGDNHNAFAHLDFPETNSNKFQTVNISQTVKIDDKEAFNNFNNLFFQKEIVRVTIEGKTHVKPKGLTKKYSVNFKKTMDVKGLNLFKGTKVAEGEITKKDKDGNNFKGVAEIPNASYFTLDVGDTVFTNFADDKNVGTLEIKGLFLRPGINKLNVTAKLDQAKLQVAATDTCKDGKPHDVPFKLLGKSVKNDGKVLEYFQGALASANQSLPIDIAGFIKKDLKLDVCILADN